MPQPFHSPYSHGFIRAAVCIPFVRVADPAYNVQHTLGLARQASAEHAAVALFPELGLSAYTNDDLFHQDALLEASTWAVAQLVEASRDLSPLLLVGAPLRFEGKLFNCAVVIYRGRVLGTGDLSEQALGWATYGVGDQMSHYNVNTSVPKTLIQHLIRWVVESRQFRPEVDETLISILGTEISPELVPGDGDQPAQSTEQKIGPYELQDFNIYYTTRFGLRPSKVAYLSLHAWGDKNRGHWPDLLPNERRHEYDLATIKKWLEVFLWRFFKTSQFKRSAVPNGPKVGSGGSLSPRGDWRAPSDSEAVDWLEELRANVPDELAT